MTLRGRMMMCGVGRVHDLGIKECGTALDHMNDDVWLISLITPASRHRGRWHGRVQIPVLSGQVLSAMRLCQQANPCYNARIGRL
jgi:hypothetical protein